MNKNNIITIVTQEFYGNRTMTEINIDNLDRFVMGILTSRKLFEDEIIDRSIIYIPNTNLVVIYNKYAEEHRRELIKGKEDRVKPTAIIPEINAVLYSRCIACRIEEGELKSVKEDDFDIIIKYFTE